MLMSRTGPRIILLAGKLNPLEKRCHMSKQTVLSVSLSVCRSFRYGCRWQNNIFASMYIFTHFRNEYLGIDHHGEHMCVTNMHTKQKKK